MYPVSNRAGAALALSILAALAAGCGQHRSVLAPRPDAGEPTLALKAVREFASTADKPRYALSWQLKSGAADHYVYAVNPRSADVVDASWETTDATTFSLAVPARRSALERREGQPAAARTFVVRAVDAKGRMSHPEQISILDDNITPSVQILSPYPSNLVRANVPPNIEIDWQGIDPDGVPTTQPYLYKYTLLTPFTPVGYATALADPDSVRRYYEPRDYEGWTPVGGIGFESPATKYVNLIPGSDLIFVVVAQDQRGAYTQVFTLNSNMLNMRVAPAGTGGPRLTLFNSSFNYTYSMPSSDPDSVFEIQLEIGVGQPITLNWSAQPAFGSNLTGYRWALDIADVHDETPRTDPITDITHWSAWDLSTTSVTLGPFGSLETHKLFVEARDSFLRVSLGIVQFHVIQSSYDRPLLIVNDTRFAPDMRSGSNACMNPPVGRWPTAAELDTFLFARGGYPWRCYPAGTLTEPGLFAGYPFDTLGTRGLPGGAVSLAILGRYRHVVWLTDYSGALNTNPPGSSTAPITSLRYMTQPGQTNNLATYVLNGGRLWAAGGGVSLASLINYNSSVNDPPGGFGAGITFSSLGPGHELIPGRFPYDVAGWRSEIKISTPSFMSFVRSLGRFEGTGSIYNAVPPAMQPKSPATDPLPPQRSNPGDFYQTQFTAEYVSQPNYIQEDIDPGPGEDFESTLDTLYSVQGNSLVQNSLNPVMTVYHPLAGPPTVWTGFSLWNFRRADCRQLVDFVLLQEWGLLPVARPELARGNVTGAWRPQRTTEH